MNRTEGLELLVATSDQSVAATVTDHLTATAGVREVTVVDSGDEATARAAAGAVDGVVVDTIAEPAATVDGLTATGTVPVVFLTDGEREQDSVEAVLDAGALDVFPRTLAETQHELIVERIRGARHSRTRPDGVDTGGLRSDSGPFRDVFESVSDGLVVHDPESGAILEVNERYCEITGYDRTELLNQSVRTIISDESEYTDENAIEQINRARTDGPQLFEFEGERKDGRRFVGEVHLRTIEIDGEERVLASVRDITERRERERELSEQRRLYSTLVEQEYEQIFNAVQDAILVMDPETLEIIDANEAYLDLVGDGDLETVRELGVDGLSAVQEGFTAEEGRQVHQQIAETGESELVEWRVETKDGERRWLEIKVTPAVINGEEVNVAIHRDVTEQRQMECRQAGRRVSVRHDRRNDDPDHRPGSLREWESVDPVTSSAQ
jgi:PAS domain S-box-containing protein